MQMDMRYNKLLIIYQSTFIIFIRKKNVRRLNGEIGHLVALVAPRVLRLSMKEPEPFALLMADQCLCMILNLA